MGRHSLDNGNLTINDIAEEDRGVYVCTASNDADEVSAEAELLIENVPPRAPYNLTALPSLDSIHVSWVPGTPLKNILIMAFNLKKKCHCNSYYVIRNFVVHIITMVYASVLKKVTTDSK